MERIGWWFLRHSKPHEKVYACVCPKCNMFIPMAEKVFIKKNGKHDCGTKLEVVEVFT